MKVAVVTQKDFDKIWLELMPMSRMTLRAQYVHDDQEIPLAAIVCEDADAIVISAETATAEEVLQSVKEANRLHFLAIRAPRSSELKGENV